MKKLIKWFIEEVIERPYRSVAIIGCLFIIVKCTTGCQTAKTIFSSKDRAARVLNTADEATSEVLEEELNEKEEQLNKRLNKDGIKKGIRKALR